MKIDPSIYEEEFLDDEDVPFQKLTHKIKVVRQDQKTLIKQKRKEKLKRQEASEQTELGALIDDIDQERY